MNRRLLLQVQKEFRALLPWWLGTFVVLGVLWALQQSGPDFGLRLRLHSLSLGAYAFGAICLGALSVGHEYTHGTLSGLLAQPAPKHHLFQVKAGVLIVMLALLALVALSVFPVIHDWTDSASTWIFGLPLLSGLCLSPWLTMISRGPLAGAVFAAALPIGAWMIGAFLDVPPGAVWPIVGAVAVVGALLTWRTFLLLEVTSDRQTEVELVPWRAQPAERAERRARSRWIVLLTKELHLQQMTFVLAGIFTALWLAVWFVSTVSPTLIRAETRYALTILYGGLVSIMAGALASAEERRLGTLDWQLLLPVANRSQWRLKVGVAINLAVLLAFVLPTVLQWLVPDPLVNEGFHPFLAGLLCITAVYVSSLSGSGVHATIATVPTLAVAAGVAVLATWPLTNLLMPGIQTVAEWVTPRLDLTRDLNWRWPQYQAAAGWALGAVLMLAFAGANHRFADRNRSRVMRQLAGLVGVALVVVLTWMMTDAVLMEWHQLQMKAYPNAFVR